MPVAPGRAEEVNLLGVQIRRAQDHAPADFKQRSKPANHRQRIAQVLDRLAQVNDVKLAIFRNDKQRILGKTLPDLMTGGAGHFACFGVGLETAGFPVGALGDFSQQSAIETADIEEFNRTASATKPMQVLDQLLAGLV